MDRIDMRLADARTLRRARRHARRPAAARCGSACPACSTSARRTLSIIGDFVPFGISQALGQRAGGNSLDNTLRVASRAPTEWVLADIRVHAIADGFGHGLVHLWAEDGTLARHREPVHDRAQLARGAAEHGTTT